MPEALSLSYKKWVRLVLYPSALIWCIIIPEQLTKICRIKIFLHSHIANRIASWALHLPSHFSRICTVSPSSRTKPCGTAPRKLHITKGWGKKRERDIWGLNLSVNFPSKHSTSAHSLHKNSYYTAAQKTCQPTSLYHISSFRPLSQVKLSSDTKAALFKRLLNQARLHHFHHQLQIHTKHRDFLVSLLTLPHNASGHTVLTSKKITKCCNQFPSSCNHRN